jgi:formate hydrogenlyase subunit 6/NADH:ubiquinone oxidoreductase subunit I
MSFFSMSKTLLRSLFAKPETVPVKRLSEHFQPGTRGHVNNEISACIFCGICERKCPTNAIQVDKQKKEWAIDRFRCIQCNCCVEVCPKKCLLMGAELPGVAAVKSLDIVVNA